MAAIHRPARCTTGSALCRRVGGGAAARARRGADEPPSASSRPGVVGEGGDRTLVIDQPAEDVVFAELQRAARRGRALHARSPRSAAIVDFGDPGLLVVVDPIDGSLNAKRGLPHHALSIAVADGPTMADVAASATSTTSAPREEWRAERGGGRVAQRRAARRRRRPSAAPPTAGSRSSRSSRPHPRWLAAAAPALLARRAYRVRAIGAIAISLCQVAAGRVDAMASLRPLPLGRRRRRAADRARVRRPRRLPVASPTPLGRAARRPDRALPGRRRAHAGRASTSPRGSRCDR